MQRRPDDSPACCVGPTSRHGRRDASLGLHGQRRGSVRSPTTARRCLRLRADSSDAGFAAPLRSIPFQPRRRPRSQGCDKNTTAQCLLPYKLPPAHRDITQSPPARPKPTSTTPRVTSSGLIQTCRIRPNTRSGPPCEFVPEPLLCHDAAPSTLLTRCCQASRHHIHHRARHSGRHGPADAGTAPRQHRQGPQGLHRGRHQPARGVTEPLPERPAGSHRHADTRGRRGTGWRDAGRRDAPRTPTEQEPPAPGQTRPT